MQYLYKTNYLRISARKIRLIAYSFKDMQVNTALEVLTQRSEKAARIIFKSLKSALSSSKDKGAVEEDLKIRNIVVDEGPQLKRRLIKPRGRADLIKKRMSHLTIVLKDKRKRKKRVDQKEKI
ncbi:50S ribosomal protein L22 [Patescibacteria group bacterium]|nr:50S ribosomal protein L22 [Patescibacteria group bacterium]